MKKISVIALTLSSLLFISGCASHAPHDTAATQAATPTETPAMVGAVMVDMKNSKGESVGSAWVAPAKEGGKGVIVQLDLHGLPAGTHGIHLHEKGSCVAPDFKSAGGHFSPVKHDHGTMSKNGPHAGDLGNIEIAANGTLQTRIENDHVDLGVSMKSLQQGAGTSLIIHAKADDNKSQPAGNSGDRIACGEIHALTK